MASLGLGLGLYSVALKCKFPAPAPNAPIACPPITSNQLQSVDTPTNHAELCTAPGEFRLLTGHHQHAMRRSRAAEPRSSGLLHPPEAQRLLAAAAADAAAPRAEFLVAPPAALHKPLAALLDDPRDLPILFLYLNVLLTTAPAAAALFYAFPPATRPLPHWLGAAYLLINYVLYLARFMLSLHYSQHRRLFRKGEWQCCCPVGGR